MGNNFSSKLTGNQFGQKKNQELVFNNLIEKNHLKLRRNAKLLIIHLVHQDHYLFTHKDTLKNISESMAKL